MQARDKYGPTNQLITMFTKLLTMMLVCVCLFAVSASGQRRDQLLKTAGSPVYPKVLISWNRYYDSEALETLCRKIAKAYPHLAKLRSIGKSQQGRHIWCLTITDFSKGDPNRKPAMYIQGNLHGGEIQGGEFALYTAWYLTESFGDTRYIQDLLGDKVFYIVSTVNPDSRDYFIHQPSEGGSPRGFRKRDDPGFNDLDGDGNITQMRIKNPRGIYRIDPDDSRRMVRLDEKDIVEINGLATAKDSDPRNYDVIMEGGVTNINGPGKADKIGFLKWEYDPNRNWIYKWESETTQEATWQPFSFPETRAVRDFFLSHPNIDVAESLHNFGGELYPGLARKREEDANDSEEDLKIYDKLGKHGEEVLPGYKYKRAPRGLPGREIDWMFGYRGAFAFISELMGTPTNREEDLYKFSGELLFDDAFVAWHKVDHPKIGKIVESELDPWHQGDHPTVDQIEVGGFKKNFGRLDPGFLLEADAHRNMAFSLYLCHETPKLEIRDIVVREIGNGLQEIATVISNSRLLPTHSGPDLAHKIVRPDYVTLQTGGRVVAAMELDADRKIITKQKENPQRYELANIPGNSTVTVQWIVQGKGPYSIIVDSIRGGTISARTK